MEFGRQLHGQAIRRLKSSFNGSVKLRVSLVAHTDIGRSSLINTPYLFLRSLFINDGDRREIFNDPRTTKIQSPPPALYLRPNRYRFAILRARLNYLRQQSPGKCDGQEELLRKVLREIIISLMRVLHRTDVRRSAPRASKNLRIKALKMQDSENPALMRFIGQR